MDGGMTPALTEGVSLDHYRRLFTEARDLTATAREMAQKNRRYYDGKLDAKLRQLLKRRKMPDFVINRVRPGVEGMVGIVERGKSDPIALPRNPADEESADAATDGLRYVCDVNRWHRIKCEAFRNILIEGTAGILTEVDAKLEVRFRRIRWEEFFYDPYSRELDFADASYMGIAKWQYLDEITAAYPEHREALVGACSAEYVDSTWQDRPNDNGATWADPKRRRLLVVEMYRRQDGVWWKCVFVSGVKLEEGPSPYLDDDGQPCNPIEAYSAYIDDENNRYGHVIDMIGPQDEINTYRRKAAHRATFRQLQETDPIAAYADPEEARREAARPDGVLPPGYQVVPDDKFGMDMSLLQEAKAEIERVGPNPSLLARGDASSGRQDLIRQQAGLTELAHLFGGIDDLEWRVMRQAWSRMRQFWREPKWLRVRDEEGERGVRFLQVNEPVWGAPAPVIDPNTGFPQIDPVTRKIVMQPQFLGYRNELAKMSVDIIIDSTPDTANVQQEQYAQLVELAKVGALGPNPGPILLEAASFPRKRRMIEKIEAMSKQEPSPEQQQAARLALAKEAAGIDKTTAQAEEARARAARTAVQARNDMRPLVDPLMGPAIGL
jgi:hypothetical protein